MTDTTFRIKIESGNAAMVGLDGTFSLVEILENLTQQLRSEVPPVRASGPVRDTNGNRVGKYSYSIAVDEQAQSA